MTKKALKRSEFDEMPQEQQLEILHRDGVYVGKRKIGEQTVVLFQLNTFYVELYYTNYRKDLGRLLTSEDTTILQPYIDQIHVRDLWKDKGNH